MSDWEVVGGKHKKEKPSNKKNAKKETQKFLDKAPKIEDILPASEVHTLYAINNAEVPNKKNGAIPNKNKVDEGKKNEKKAPKNPSGKKSAPRKAVSFTAAMIALGKQNFDDLKLEVEIGGKRFSEIPLMRLSNLAAYVNQKLGSEKYSLVLAFETLHMPLKQLPSNVHSLLQKELLAIGEPALADYFVMCLQMAVEEHSKGSQINGYLLFLQLLSVLSPNCVTSNISKIKSLLEANSKKPSNVSVILWACCLEALKSFFAGYKALTSIVLPHLDNHPQAVSAFLQYLFSSSPHVRPVSPTMFAKLLHSFVHPPFSKSSSVSLYQSHFPSFIKSSINTIPRDTLHEYFETSLKYLTPTLSIRIKPELCSFTYKCLISDPKTSGVWKNIFTKNLSQSSVLLSFISEKNSTKVGNGAVKDSQHGKGDSNVDKKSTPGVDLQSLFGSLLKTANDLSEKKKSQEGLQECKKCGKLLESLTQTKMSAKSKASKQQKSSFSWKVLLFVIIFAAASLIAYDINKHGSFKASKTGVFLKESGTLQFVDQASAKSKVYYNQAHKWTVKNTPIYYNATVEFATPYAILAKETSLVVYNNAVKAAQTISSYVQQKWPDFIKWVDQYAPEGFTHHAQESAVKAWTASKFYFWEGVTLSAKYFKSFDEWARTNLFTGNMSPENMKKYASLALNSTQKYALDTYSWIAQKVETTFSTKIK
ncbi:unnamed protein product [Bemisia tabaci]|uniref:Transmembrane protein 214-A n=1 Tax=Bemisia tabaci TaxID=7038 RepID=A0A9P0AM84_BEMTA|nr:unnamed protein product [Bemisia tabaci]